MRQRSADVEENLSRHAAAAPESELDAKLQHSRHSQVLIRERPPDKMGAEERIRPPSPGTSNRVTPENSLDNLKSIEAKLPVADSLFGGPAEQLAPECDEGNIEYKLKLVDVDDDRFDRLVTQLRYRLTEGLGEALYELGVGDDGKPHGLDENDLNESLSTLRRMAAAVGAEVTVLHCREGRSVGHVIEAIVRERPLDGGAGLIELRVAVVGNVDSGKSTLVGALRRPAVPSARRRRVEQPRETTSRRRRTVALHAVEQKGKQIASMAW